jgi:hypothetical protein
MRLCALLLMLACSLVPASGETIYAAVVNGDILAVDTNHMTSTVLAHTHVCWYDIAFAADGKLYGSDANSLFLIDPASGHSSLIGSFGAFINGLAFVGDTLYGSGYGLYTVNLTSGQAQLVGGIGYTSSGDLQWFQGSLYLTASGQPGDRLLRLDPANGDATLVGEIGFPWVYGLAATSSELIGLTANGDVLTIDVNTGAGARLGSAGRSVYGATSKPAQPSPHEIPEPSALLLLGSGLSAIGVSLRRR